MGDTTRIGCTCGQTRLEVRGAPIASVECCCASCREAGERFRHLEGAPDILTEYGATPFVMYRKDRVRFLGGSEGLKAVRLSQDASTRRIVATCWNTPVFLELKGGHWLSLYGELWSDGTRPPPQMRTMASNLPSGAVLPDDIPNAKKQNLGFFARLFGAWVAMGFRNPKMSVTGEIDV
ncbi:GFA family protein [Roseovarius sp. M141]|uniref:GFA family protein n=1 Tax=Roseovarius sp. M141 TaxID=2583806 RepID=UPI0020CF82D8|nr:hypothetical protein [Roseovarius sp. M141]MCQ0091370.1 hypothetical protein [Roseovarius sp. M141]